MPFIKNITTPNGVSTAFHKLVKIEAGPDLTQLRATIASWTSEADYLAGAGPVWHSYETLNSSEVADLVSTALLTSGAFSGASTVADDSDTTDGAKYRKNLDINAWRLAANRSSFEFGGKAIACDELSRSDIDAVQAIVARYGQLPAGWLGAWKAMDNSYVSIPDVATWDSFFAAMVAQGQANFNHAQTLKAALGNAQTVEEVNAIIW